MKQLLILFVLSVLISSCTQKEELKPSDFDMFWEKSVTELNSIPMESIKIGQDSVIEDKIISHYKIRSLDSIFFNVWVSVPIKEGKFPTKIRFSGYGEENYQNNRIVHLWFLKQKQSINMLVDVRGQGVSKEQINPEDFLTEGLQTKETYIYRGAFMDVVRSVDFISENKKGNGKIIVTGGSQGGAFSIVAAALNKKVSLCVADFPFLTDIPDYDKKGWPMKIFLHKAQQENMDYFDLKKTLSYFDMLNFAEKIDVPVFMRTEAIDRITPPEGAISLFNAIKGQRKVLYVDPCKGHGCSSSSGVANEMEKVFIQKYNSPAN